MTAGRKNTDNKQDWNTPSKYVSVISQFFNNSICLDPCSNNQSIVDAKRKIMLPEDGLKAVWNYPTIYINPPYGRNAKDKTTIKTWIKKAWETHNNYGSEILMLIPVATNTSHWKQFIFGKAKICFLADTRLVFRINGKEDNKGSPMACSMIYYGVRNRCFYNVFSVFGYVCQ